MNYDNVLNGLVALSPDASGRFDSHMNYDNVLNGLVALTQVVGLIPT
jgi:hypothetical protein